MLKGTNCRMKIIMHSITHYLRIHTFQITRKLRDELEKRDTDTKGTV